MLERETYKRALNLKLINLMITKIPNESKFCVSYGQLQGCYWTIPATSTQGTTKEGDKDYIVRVSLSPKMDLELHKKVFLEFVGSHLIVTSLRALLKSKYILIESILRSKRGNLYNFYFTTTDYFGYAIQLELKSFT